jgi:hypothetical protein
VQKPETTTSASPAFKEKKNVEAWAGGMNDVEMIAKGIAVSQRQDHNVCDTFPMARCDVIIWRCFVR